MTVDESTCHWCDEPILASESIAADFPLLHMHRECALRGVLGSLGHLQRRCSCFVKGSEAEHDPLHVSKRDAARWAAVVYYRQVGEDARHLPFAWPLKDRVRCRPPDFEKLPGDEQWAIDESLGILDGWES